MYCSTSPALVKLKVLEKQLLVWEPCVQTQPIQPTTRAHRQTGQTRGPRLNSLFLSTYQITVRHKARGGKVSINKATQLLFPYAMPFTSPLNIHTVKENICLSIHTWRCVLRIQKGYLYPPRFSKGTAFRIKHNL